MWDPHAWYIKENEIKQAKTKKSKTKRKKKNNNKDKYRHSMQRIYTAKLSNSRFVDWVMY